MDLAPERSRSGCRVLADGRGVRSRGKPHESGTEAVTRIGGDAEGGARHDRLSGPAAGIHRPELVGDVECLGDAADLPARRRSWRLQARTGSRGLAAANL